VSLPKLDRFKAVLWGLACGDALGAPTEFMGLETIRHRYGESGIKDIRQTSGQFTDDTQMTVALAEGLLDTYEQVEGSGPEDAVATLMAEPPLVMPYVAKRFVEWAFGPKNNRAPGTTCMGGCRALRAGKPWTQSGIMSSRGCGSAMRASPVGLVYKDPDQLAVIARASSIVTHGHQAALDAAHAAAFAVRALLEGTQPEELVGLVIDVCAKDERFYELLGRVARAVEATVDGEVASSQVMTFKHTCYDHDAGAHVDIGLGESWVGDEAVASALYCFLLAYERGEGYVEAVRYGANTAGDSDSIACIAGSFAGAYWGLGGDKGVPQEWIDHVEDRDELELLAQRLYNLADTFGYV
jgi:ADP-ribosylglycohydrolase